MKKLLVATKNPGKVRELSRLLEDLSLEIVSLSDMHVDADVEEDGKDYFENSKKKAEFYADLTGLPAISDDGGLEIEALGGAPGVKSRRWLGYEATDEELIEYMKKVAQDLPDDNRTAYFRTVITLALPKGENLPAGRQAFQEFGEVKGIIAKEAAGNKEKGYPYRMYFYIPELGKYYQDEVLTPEEMKQYNHRYKAIRNIREHIRKVYSL